MVPSEKTMKFQPKKMFVSENFIRKSNEFSEKKLFISEKYFKFSDNIRRNDRDFSRNESAMLWVFSRLVHATMRFVFRNQDHTKKSVTQFIIKITINSMRKRRTRGHKTEQANRRA